MMERPEVSLVLSYETRNDDINSAQHPESTGKASIDRTDIHYFSYVHPLTFKGQVLAASLNYQKVYAFDKKVAFPFNLNSGTTVGTIQYQMEQEGDISALIPAIAWEPTPNLSLGLSTFLWDHSLTGASSFTKHEKSSGTIQFDNSLFGGAGGSVSVMDTLDFKQTYSVDSGVSFNLGAMWRMNHLWKCAAVIKPSYKLKLQKTTDIHLTQIDANTNVQYNQINTSSTGQATLTYPSSYAIGFARQFNDTGVISMDFTYTDWSNYTLTESGQTVNPVSGKADASGSTLAIRLGGEYLWVRNNHILPFRGGLGIDPEPAVDGQDVFYTASMGSGINWKNMIIDWATQVRFGFDVGKSTYQGINGEATVTQVKSVIGFSYWL